MKREPLPPGFRRTYPGNDPENGPAYLQRWTGVLWICAEHRWPSQASVREADEEFTEEWMDSYPHCQRCGDPPSLHDRVVECRAIIKAAEEHLSCTLTRGQRRDLLTDNSLTCYDREEIEEAERIIWESPIIGTTFVLTGELHEQVGVDAVLIEYDTQAEEVKLPSASDLLIIL
jgi:hypothetical protein